MKVGEVKVCEQMLKLRQWLNEHNIEWKDGSDSWSFDDIQHPL